MFRKLLLIMLTSILGILITSSCELAPVSSNLVKTTTPVKSPVNLPNPASAYCIENGNRLEIRTAADGSQFGVCIFEDGSECPEWAYLNGGCGFGKSVGIVENKAVEVVKILLANQLGMDISLISLHSLEHITWMDDCLAIQAPGDICNLVDTPGFRVILKAGDEFYTYHTDLTGEKIRKEDGNFSPQ